MRYYKPLQLLFSSVLCSALVGSTLAEDKPAKPTESAGQPSEAEMMTMMAELAKPGENHKLLTDGAGKWDYKVKMWMSPDPNSEPMESTGTSVAKAVMGGRYVITEHTGKMMMPGADGAMTETEFKGMAVEGYDNVKKKFVSSWIDNMGTGIMMSEGTYDSSKKAFTYLSEYSMIPGVTTKIREVITVIDKDHRKFEFFEDRGGTEVRTMDIMYTRKS